MTAQSAEEPEPEKPNSVVAQNDDTGEVVRVLVMHGHILAAG